MRTPIPKRWIAISAAATCFLGLVGLLAYLSFPKPVDQEWQHVARVLLRGEFEYRAPTVARYAKPVRIGLLDATAEDRAAVAELVADLNVLVAGSGVAFSIGEFGKSEISAGFESLAAFPNVARFLNLPYVPGNSGVFWPYAMEDGALAGATILISNDSSGSLRRHIIFEEIYQSLGPHNDSPLYPESIVYERDGDGGSATRLADIDRKLLRFLYLHLKPGDGIAEVRRAYDAHWRDLAVPSRPETP